jgi:hypothetical protein
LCARRAPVSTAMMRRCEQQPSTYRRPLLRCQRRARRRPIRFQRPPFRRRSRLPNSRRRAIRVRCRFRIWVLCRQHHCQRPCPSRRGISLFLGSSLQDAKRIPQSNVSMLAWRFRASLTQKRQASFVHACPEAGGSCLPFRALDQIRRSQTIHGPRARRGRPLHNLPLHTYKIAVVQIFHAHFLRL